MNLGSRLLRAHVWFAREGDTFTVPSNGTVSRTSMPGATDTSYRYCGIVKDASVETNTDKVEVFAPSPGALKLYDVLESKRTVKLTFTLSQLGPLALELFFKTGKLTESSTEFAPLSAGEINGWLKFQYYDHKNNLVLTMDAYCHVEATGALKGGENELAEIQLTATLLDSPLNNIGI
jgi:hypothetical protein